MIGTKLILKEHYLAYLVQNSKMNHLEATQEITAIIPEIKVNSPIRILLVLFRYSQTE